MKASERNLNVYVLYNICLRWMQERVKFIWLHHLQTNIEDSVCMCVTSRPEWDRSPTAAILVL